MCLVSLFKKGRNLDTVPLKGGDNVKTWGEHHLHAKEMPGTDSNSQPSEGTNLADILISDFQPPELSDNTLFVA